VDERQLERRHELDFAFGRTELGAPDTDDPWVSFDATWDVLAQQLIVAAGQVDTFELLDGTALETRELELRAEAGRRYTLHAGWGLYGPSVWITDTASQLRVVTAPTLPVGKLPPVGAR